MAYEGDDTLTDLTTEQLLLKMLKEMKKLNLYLAEASGFEATDDDIEV